MTEGQALVCAENLESSCVCIQIETKCTFGPDHKGQFTLDQGVSARFAETCDPEFCVCTSHEDYHVLVAHRIENARNNLIKPEKSTSQDVVPAPFQVEDNEQSDEAFGVSKPDDPEEPPTSDSESSSQSWKEQDFELSAKYYTAITFSAIAVSLCSLVMMLALCVWCVTMEQRAHNSRRERGAKRAKLDESNMTVIEGAARRKVAPSVPSASEPPTERKMLETDEDMMIPGYGKVANHNNISFGISPGKSIEVRQDRRSDQR